VPHQVYKDESLKEVVVKGHAHSMNQHWYRKIDGVWKFAGLNPTIRWSEYDFDKVFASGRESFGDAGAEIDTAKMDKVEKATLM
jgi:scytalone dehydratase